MSQAMDKNDIKLETDSLITLATNYFDDTDPVHAGYAWFYHARTANNRDSVNERANNLLKAQEYAEKTDNYKLIGLVYGEKGQMYKNQQQYDSSICYFKKAFYSLKYLQDSRNQVLCLFYIGDNFLYLSKCDSALKYYKTAENFLIHSNDTLILSSFYRNFGSGYFQLNDFKQALRYYKLVPDTKIPIYDSNKYYLIAKTYIQI
jgi:tetratricopeptide (TPR) repeat protein